MAAAYAFSSGVMDISAQELFSPGDTTLDKSPSIVSGLDAKRLTDGPLWSSLSVSGLLSD